MAGFLCMRIFYIVVFFLSTNAVAKEPAHKLELGVALGGQWLNDYRGSKESQVNLLPFPFATYQGNIFKVDDEDGARGEFLRNDHYELNISGDLSLRSDSKDNRRREGMPELKTAFEIGPEFNLNLTGQTLREGWMLRLPVRAALVLENSHIRYIGHTFNPKFTYRNKNAYRGWRLKLDVGALYGSRGVHDYFYSVEEEFVRFEREHYLAKSGFGGWYSKASVYKRYGNWLYRASIRYDNLSAATFVDSPLVETRDYAVLSFGVAWVFHKMSM